MDEQSKIQGQLFQLEQDYKREKNLLEKKALELRAFEDFRATALAEQEQRKLDAKHWEPLIFLLIFSLRLLTSKESIKIIVP